MTSVLKAELFWLCGRADSGLTNLRLTHLQAILLALDRKDREREMVSVLLAELHPKTLSEEQIGEGFTAIMLSCEVPTACTAPSPACS